jgi:hypothetical protein
MLKISDFVLIIYKECFKLTSKHLWGEEARRESSCRVGYVTFIV